jgi:hypothetical protein
MVVRLKFSNNRNPGPRARARPVNVHVDVHVIVDVVGFFVTIGYILPASRLHSLAARLSQSENKNLAAQTVAANSPPVRTGAGTARDLKRRIPNVQHHRRSWL